MWVLLKEYLQQNELASIFNDRYVSNSPNNYLIHWLPSMSRFPRWRNLKHLPSPTTIDYSDGQTFLDILKVCRQLHSTAVTYSISFPVGTAMYSTAFAIQIQPGTTGPCNAENSSHARP
jgi:hypothetical protein